MRRTDSDYFAGVSRLGLELSGVTTERKYDGSPVLRRGGAFMAGLAGHTSAEPESLVVRYDLDERESLIEDAPEIYYVTDYYRRYPLVLARLARLTPDALRDLLRVSWQLTEAKAVRSGRRVAGARGRAPRIR